MIRRTFLAVLMVLGIGSVAGAQATRPAASQPALDLNPALPTIFLAGDSTAQVGDPLHTAWGKEFGSYVDRSKANWVNAARGGRSSRTFIAEGLWDHLISNTKPGDFVFIQFGHNDGGAVNDASRARGSLPGLGDETQEIDNQVTHQHEIVHTYGWYMKKMVDDTKAKGAAPILVSLTVRDIWKDGKVERGNGMFGKWTEQIATEKGIPFVDLTTLAADYYDELGEAKVKPFFPADTTHTGPDAAALNAAFVLTGVKSLHMEGFVKLLTPAAAQMKAPITQP
jgi:lysophospholipase L1-like esterase